MKSTHTGEAKMDTRGLRHLKAYLGEEATTKAKAKRAVDVVPVLAARKAGTTSSSAASTKTANSAAAAALSPSVMQHVERHLPAGATHKLTRTQVALVEALASTRAAAADTPSEPSVTRVAVTRGKVATLEEMVDTVALSALELAARTSASNKNTTATAAMEMSSLFVLTDDAAMVAAVSAQLESRYGLTVLRLADASAPRHPSFPTADGGASTGSKTAAAAATAAKTKGKRSNAKTAAAAVKVDTSTTDVAAAPPATMSVVVVVASPAGFLAVDRRSALWKFIGGVAVLLHYPESQSSSLLSVLKGGEAATTPVTPQALNAQRWACLGHVARIAVVALQQAWLSLSSLDLLTTLRLAAGQESAATATAASSSSAVAKALAASRRPVTVHYSVAEGTQRFQFLFGLLKGLVPRRGLVVHVATKECAAFLYDTLYAFMEELPSYLQLLSDYEGASAYTNMHTATDRQRLCGAFDKVVLGEGGEKTACVLISCHGLVPKRGQVFLQYDIIPDVVNYTQFIAEVLTPGAVTATEVAVTRETTTRQRKRSVSPTPSPSSSRRGSAVGAAAAAAAATVQDSPACYTHILLLLRPNEVAGLLMRLRGAGSASAAARYRLDFHELPNKAGGRYLFIGEKLKSMNKKLFAVQNAAYYAYKATMRAYCTVGPRDVYDETQVKLEKVAEEFGYVELPLLDLRLKDTVFRPKEDYYRAARQKQEAERRAYKQFAKEHIVGEAPDEHFADAQVAEQQQQ